MGGTRTGVTVSRIHMPLAELWTAKGGLCALCGQPMPLADASRDHVIPRSMGGSSSARNLRLTCTACNNARGNKFPYGEFRRMSEATQRGIWARDRGACVQCGYRQGLVFCKRQARPAGQPRVRLLCMPCLLGRPDDMKSPAAVASRGWMERAAGE